MYMALLTVYENNLRILHWKTCGIIFLPIHKWLNKFYVEFGNMLDAVAEQILSADGQPVSAKESLEMLTSQSDISAMLIDPATDYTPESALNAAYMMFQQAHDMVISLINDTASYPPDIIDILIKQADYYRLEGLYKMKRSLKICQPTPQPSDTTVISTTVTDTDEDDDEDDDD